SASLTHVGRVRSVNEDSVLATEDLWVVCDGLGGHDGGEHASRVAAETVVELAVPAEGADSLVTAIRAAHERVVERGLELGIPIMGTRSEEHTSELQSRENLVCRLLLEK